MNEFENKVNVEKNDVKPADEKVKLNSEELNSPLESVDSNQIPKLDSCDCRSECKYHTGYGHKYANYGYSG